MPIRLLTYTLLIFLLAGCNSKEKTDWSISLDRDDKKPYGAYLAYKSLPYYFPNTKVEALSRQFRFTSIDENMRYGEPSLLILAGLDFHLSEEEWNYLYNYVYEGNYVLLFASKLDDKLRRDIQIAKPHGLEEYPLMDAKTAKKNKAVLSLHNRPNKKYGYEGRWLQGQIEISEKPAATEEAEEENATNALDEFYTEEEEYVAYEDVSPDTIIMLGNVKGNPNFVSCAIGDGELLIHAAPLSISNYFLLQDDNRKYYSGILQSIPPVSKIYWIDYYKRRTEKSDFSVLWRYPATKWALIIALIALAIYVLFESKRRQRLIPIRTAPENTSVSFVETVGKLYYNKGNHSNLAHKMIQHFLEWVRSRYYIDTNHLNENFINKLVQKSGMPESHVRELMDMIAEVRLGHAYIDDAYLYRMHYLIHSFYKK